jgi:hypothetical protein
VGHYDRLDAERNAKDASYMSKKSYGYIQLLAETAFSEPEKLRFCDDEGAALVQFGPVSRINLIVGANNSGKSRLLRELFKLPNYAYWEDRSVIPGVAGGLNFLNSETQHSKRTVRYNTFTNHLNFSRLFVTDFNHNVEANGDAWRQHAKSIAALLGSNSSEETEKRLQRFGTHLACFAAEDPDSGIRATAHEGTQEIWKAVWPALKPFVIGQQAIHASVENNQKRIFVPILRSAWHLHDQLQPNTIPATYLHIFAAALQRNYSIDGGNVHSGQALYESLHSARNGDISARENLEMFEEFVRSTFFGSTKKFSIVARTPLARREISVRMDGVEHPLHFLGDGVVGVIMLLYPMFMAEKGAYFFIEEPENSLHAGYQRLLFKTILNNQVLREKELKVFCTTHSNHLLGLAMEGEDVSVFRVQKDGNGDKANTRVSCLSGPDMDLLDELGVSNTSVYLAKCSIWVEGPTDRAHLQGYLRAYYDVEEHEPGRGTPIEGLDYTFVEFGGSILSHYSFNEPQDCVADKNTDAIAARLTSNRVFLLVDFDDKAKQAKWAEIYPQTTSAPRSHFQFSHTGRRELENLVSPETLGRFLASLDKAGEFKSTTASYAAYEQMGIGTYLNQLTETTIFTTKAKQDKPPTIGKKAKSRTRQSVTVSKYYKKLIADYVNSNARWDTMSPDAQELTKRIVDFIDAHSGTTPLA